ncbi:MAG TPA: CheR family methyltransferase [Myxococcaceae bacterium]|nr:CheR family methyltransferase [Myxococcaceae bacterium]
MIDPGLEDYLVEQLAAFASAQIGFAETAIRPDAIRKVLREELRLGGGTLDGLVRKLLEQDARVLGALWSAVLVGETYFFRQVEHFEWLASIIPALALEVEGPIRAWSAGCSTGEEAYSIAACFLAALHPARAEVLGTDISPASLQTARAGTYSRWSSRQSSPPLFPVHQMVGPDRLQVLPEVQALTRFVEHNLLEPARPALGELHVIFCRNVLAYFSPPAARIAVGHLADALAPGGYAFFGAMDVERAPPGLEELPSRGQQVFRKPKRARGAGANGPASAGAPANADGPAPGAPGRAHAPAPVPPPGSGTPADVELHMRALGQIERGHRIQAEQDLLELRRRAPGYLPGLLELSLMHLRNGRRGPAEELMREILHRAGGRPDDEPCPGPEPLPVSYYRTAARALLSGPGGDP